MKFLNTLAHLHLGLPEPGWLVGALLGDAWRGRLPAAWPRSLREGVILHRYVDSHTDAHPIVARARARFAPPFRRYAGILVDVWFDHRLAVHRQSLGLAAPERVATSLDKALASYDRHLPPATLDWGRALTDPARLDAYREEASIDRALRWLATRLRRPNPLADGMTALRPLGEALEADFLAFWPELVAEAANLRRRAREQVS